MIGTVAHLPLFCGTPPVVHQTGIKDLDGNYFRIKNDLTGDFDKMDLGDTITFTIGNISPKDPMKVVNGDLRCINKLADAPQVKKGKMLLLQVDHESYQFEGGYEYTFYRSNPNVDSIPLGMHYNPPGDFGGVMIYYAPTGEVVFSGTIVWMGLGKMDQPSQLKDPTSYHLSRTPAIMPDAEEIQQIIHPNSFKEKLEYAKIWDAIKHLSDVRVRMEAGAKVGIYKYTPSVGVGNPLDWNYIVLLHHISEE
jgi:hypothetical protein